MHRPDPYQTQDLPPGFVEAWLALPPKERRARALGMDREERRALLARLGPMLEPTSRASGWNRRVARLVGYTRHGVLQWRRGTGTVPPWALDKIAREVQATGADLI
jgi:hypothetical protein